jgi:multidrug resistance efflux pump
LAERALRELSQGNPGIDPSPPSGTNWASAPPTPAHPSAATSPTTILGPGWRSRVRRVLFSCTRWILAGFLVYVATVYFWNSAWRVESEQAFINTEFVSLRTPLEGQLRFHPVRPSDEVEAGTRLFTVENTRFGNKEAAAQWNWARELADRLEVESEEAAARMRSQDEAHQLYARLYEQKVISKLELLGEEMKLTLARAAWSNKLDQLRLAKARHSEFESHVGLQRQAEVEMPFNGVVWSVHALDGAQVLANAEVAQVFDPKNLWVDALVAEKHAQKFQVGFPVHVRSVDGLQTWEGRVETARGFARQTHAAAAGLQPVAPRRYISLRIKLETRNPFDAREFYGVGRSVIVSFEKPD